MTGLRDRLNHTLAAAFGLMLATCGGSLAQGVASPDADASVPVDGAAALAQGAPGLDRLFADLARPANPGWRRIERQILTELSRSGSAAMDLLLLRGREAITAEDLPAALDHLTALTDHAPEFAEGWNARAIALFRSGRPGQAMADLERALALEPRHFGALAGVGSVLEDAGSLDAALDAYEAALAIHPNLERVREATARLRNRMLGKEI